jgi:predicted enzyme related to lactoylglutathione lyase
VVIGFERVDFVSVPTKDERKARAFYQEVLGLPADPKNPAEIAAGNLTLGFWNPEEDGIEFHPNPAGIALRVEDVAEARMRLEQAGVTFLGDTVDTGVCHMAFFLDLDGNALILHRRYAPY